MQVLCRNGPLQRVDCLSPVGNMRSVSFPRTQQRIAGSGIEPEASNLSITNQTLYHMNQSPY